MMDCQHKIRVIGLTGGTGSGKSEAARRFAELGFPVIDADAIGHEVIKPGGEAETAVIQAFGPDIVSEGHIDRSELGDRVFSDPQARKKLNEIVHPCIKTQIRRRIRDLASQGHKTVILDAALIGESGEREPCLDGLILVTCRETTRIERLMKARGLTREAAAQRVRAQTPPDKKLALADWVLDNEDSLEGFLVRVESLARELKTYET